MVRIFCQDFQVCPILYGKDTKGSKEQFDTDVTFIITNERFFFIFRRFLNLSRSKICFPE